MATVARVRKGALALPEVEARTGAGETAFYVAGQRVASLTDDGARLQVSLPAALAEAVIADQSDVTPLVRRGRTIGVEVDRASLDVRVLDRLLRQAWEASAPERLVAAVRPGAPERAASDLPAIGRPATDALALEGITTLAQVSERSEAELLDLHGVGPRAIKILRDRLEAEGRSFRPG